ncbi:MAG: outer membrane lipoprotein-sorting protein [Pseudomonadota bacterium]
MASKTALSALVLASLLLPGLAMAAQPTALPSMSATQVVDRNVAARGGLQAWRNVQTMTWKGKMGAGGTTYSAVTPAGKLETKTRPEVMLPFKLDYKRPLKSRLELDFNGQTAVQVFDGAQGWKLRPYLGKSTWDAYTPDELKLAAAEPGIDGLLIDYAARGSRVEAAGTDTVEGHAAYKLRVTLKGGGARTVWVDGQSFLELKMDGEPRKIDGRPRSVEIFPRDYRAEQGLMIAHVLETAVQGVKNTEKINIESVAVNPPLADTQFTKPQ